MKQLNFNELLAGLSSHNGAAILKLNELDPIELTTLYGTILKDLKSGNLNVQLAAAAAAVYLAPRLVKRKQIEKYQIETLLQALLLKLNFQIAPALSPAMQIQEAMVRTDAIKAISGLSEGMDDTQRKNTFERLIGFISRKDMNVQRDTQTSKAAIDALGILVAQNKAGRTKLHQQQEKLLRETLEKIDKEATLGQPALESVHRVLGTLKPSFTPIHFGFHLGHHTETGTEAEKISLLKVVSREAK